MQISVFQSKPWEPHDFIIMQKQKDILEIIVPRNFENRFAGNFISLTLAS
jgi:hypothetical protein